MNIMKAKIKFKIKKNICNNANVLKSQAFETVDDMM